MFVCALCVRAPLTWLLLALQAVGRGLAWLGLLVGLHPHRNGGVHRFAVATACFRVVVLCLSIAFVPGGVTSTASHARAIGAAVAWSHVVFCLLLALLSLTKLFRTAVGRHGDADVRGETSKASRER
jgi:hypothetical protein